MSTLFRSQTVLSTVYKLTTNKDLFSADALEDIPASYLSAMYEADIGNGRATRVFTRICRDLVIRSCKEESKMDVGRAWDSHYAETLDKLITSTEEPESTVLRNKVYIRGSRVDPEGNRLILREAQSSLMGAKQERVNRQLFDRTEQLSAASFSIMLVHYASVVEESESAVWHESLAPVISHFETHILSKKGQR